MPLTTLLQTTFTLTFVAFAATALYLFLERDRVPERYRTALRVSTVYLAIAATNYWFMRESYASAASSGAHAFPTHYRYIDWILTTPLMLLKFPLLLGVGEDGRKFMTRLVLLDMAMILAGYVGELTPGMPAAHYGFFLGGCVAWMAILIMLFGALTELPENLPASVRRGVRTMGVFVVGGWAIYPLGYFCPLLGLPGEARELVYNVADLANKVGLSLVVYLAAKGAAAELDVAAEGDEHELDPSGVGGGLVDAEAAE